MTPTITSPHAARPKGSTFKRCQCPIRKDADGHRIPCSNDHGSWSYIADVGVDPVTGKRKQLKRGGFPKQTDAQDALDRLIELLPVSEASRSHSRAYWLAAASILREDAESFRLSGVDTGHVYVVRAAPYLKIGYSKDPSRRVLELSWKKDLIQPDDLDRSACALWLSSCGSRSDERLLHWVARNYLACGEWFHADRALVDALPDLLSH